MFTTTMVVAVMNLERVYDRADRNGSWNVLKIYGDEGNGKEIGRMAEAVKEVVAGNINKGI